MGDAGRMTATVPNNIDLKRKECAIGAMLAAAYGDALGWPQEDRSRRIKSGNELGDFGLKSWKRRAGDRYRPYEEIISKGEYSDDTQLILASARSLLRSSEWWRWLASVELPTWILYERGGGGATKRSARALLSGAMPWSYETKSYHKADYFRAGGNGVAMRILPHCIQRLTDSDFSGLRSEIFLNGILTHGHPRALVGAALYGYVMWKALRIKEPLRYGELISRAVADVDEWSVLPNADEFHSNWFALADANLQGLEKTWQVTVQECLSLLKKCAEGIELEALAIDRRILESLGTFDKSCLGAGTVTAAAAIFLASRYAADPEHGVIEAAFLDGTDTDTLASMTGALLGAITGIDWLSSHVNEIQDHAYIRELAERLVQPSRSANELPPRQVKDKAVRAFLEQLRQTKETSEYFPDGRTVTIVNSKLLSSRVSKVDGIIQRRLLTNDGQTLYVKHSGTLDSVPLKARAAEPEVPMRVRHASIVMVVLDVQRAQRFYGDLLRLPISKTSAGRFRFGEIFELEETDKSMGIERRKHQFSPFLSLETESLRSIYHQVQKLGLSIIIPFSQTPTRSFFRCFDFDGHCVELFEFAKRPSEPAVREEVPEKYPSAAAKTNEAGAESAYEMGYKRIKWDE